MISSKCTCTMQILSSLRFMMEKGYARSGRALMQFVVAARRAQDIAFHRDRQLLQCYWTETLFTTGIDGACVHKLAERVAFFLADQGFQSTCSIHDG